MMSFAEDKLFNDRMDKEDNTYVSQYLCTNCSRAEFASAGVCPTGAEKSSFIAPSGKTDELVDDGAKCTSRLATLYDNAKFSDVTLVVEGRRFLAHRLLLANASDVFEHLLMSDRWAHYDKNEIVLQESEDCVLVFDSFLRYIYSGEVTLTTDSVLGLLILADKYNVADLKESCSSFMSRRLVGSTPGDSRAVAWYQYASATCCAIELQNACLNYILLNLDAVMRSPEWAYLQRENLAAVLRRSDVVLESEYSLLLAVVRWILEAERRAANEVVAREMTEENLRLLLPHVRFPMLFPWQAAELEGVAFAREHREHFAPYLLLAYRYHALSATGSGQFLLPAITESWQHQELRGWLPEEQFAYRNYTDDSYSIHVDIVRKGYRTCPRVSSKVEKPLNLPANVCNLPFSSTAASSSQQRDGQPCKMKVTFYPHGYYTTALWNGQVNLAKSTDLTKLAISHRGGLELRRAEISVVFFARSEAGGVKYADHAVNASTVFETYGSFELEDVIAVEKLRAEHSRFIVDGSFNLKVFVRPISFYTGDGSPSQ